MTGSELIEKLSIERNITIRDAEKIIAEIFKSMTKTLISGNRIEIRGFGSFEIREYGGYTGKHPKTGVEIKVKPKKLPFFKVGLDLKVRILDSGK